MKTCWLVLGVVSVALSGCATRREPESAAATVRPGGATARSAGPVVYKPLQGYAKVNPGLAEMPAVDYAATAAAQEQYQADRDEQEARTEYMKAITRRMNSGE